jgi:hypothetical protein
VTLLLSADVYRNSPEPISSTFFGFPFRILIAWTAPNPPFPHHLALGQYSARACEVVLVNVGLETLLNLVGGEQSQIHDK